MHVDPDELMERQLGQWLMAAAALRAKCSTGVADAFVNVNDGRPDREHYADSVSMIVVGATLVAHETAKALGCSIGTLAPNTEIVIEDVAPHLEQTATDRFAWGLVAEVANGRWDSVPARVNAYASPDEAGTRRVVDVTLALLRLYVQIADSNLAGASS